MLCTKISRSLSYLNCVKHFINAESLCKLYFVMVNSNLAYCINVYGCAYKTNLKNLAPKQKQAIAMPITDPILRLF